LRESGSIEQDSDVVIFLYREDVYEPTLSERPGVIDIIVSKHRGGPTGEVAMAWVGEFADIQEKHDDIRKAIGSKRVRKRSQYTNKAGYDAKDYD
jgi:replicative DNA helicase